MLQSPQTTATSIYCSYRVNVINAGDLLQSYDNFHEGLIEKFVKSIFRMRFSFAKLLSSILILDIFHVWCGGD